MRRFGLRESCLPPGSSLRSFNAEHQYSKRGLSLGRRVTMLGAQPVTGFSSGQDSGDAVGFEGTLRTVSSPGPPQSTEDRRTTREESSEKGRL